MTDPVQPLVWTNRGCTCLTASSDHMTLFYQPKQLYGNMLSELLIKQGHMGPGYRPSRQAARNRPNVRARKAAPEGANAFVLNLPVQHSATARVNIRNVRKATFFQLVQYMCSNGQLSNILYSFFRFACGCWQQFDASHKLFKLLFKTLSFLYFVLLMENIDTDDTLIDRHWHYYANECYMCIRKIIKAFCVWWKCSCLSNIIFLLWFFLL